MREDPPSWVPVNVQTSLPRMFAIHVLQSTISGLAASEIPFDSY